MGYSWRWSDIREDFFLRWELLSDICLLKKWYSRKEKIAKEFREMRWDLVNKRGG